MPDLTLGCPRRHIVCIRLFFKIIISRGKRLGMTFVEQVEIFRFSSASPKFWLDDAVTAICRFLV